MSKITAKEFVKSGKHLPSFLRDLYKLIQKRIQEIQKSDLTVSVKAGMVAKLK